MLPKKFLNLAWDVNPREVDIEKHRHWFIARVLSKGNLSQVYALEKLVGRRLIKDFLKNGGLNHLDRQTASLWLLLLGLSKKECKKRSSIKNSWKF